MLPLPANRKYFMSFGFVHLHLSWTVLKVVVTGMNSLKFGHFGNDRQIISIYYHQIASHRLAFGLYIYILPRPILTVNFMYISIANIQETVIDTENTTHYRQIGNCIWSFDLLIFHFTMAIPKCQGQDDAYFDYEYL